ncbi:hypothetical protein ACEI87_10005 [Clostridioides difficile]
MKDLYSFGCELGEKDVTKKLPVYELLTSLRKEDKNDILQSLIKCCSISDVELPNSVLTESSNGKDLIICAQKILIGILGAYECGHTIHNFFAYNKLLSLNEASKMYKKSISTLRRHIKEGRFQEDYDVFRIDSKWLFLKESLVREYGKSLLED